MRRPWAHKRKAPESPTPTPSRPREHGQSLVEFALVLPAALILLLGVIDFGMALRSYISLENATREGARFAVVGNAAGSYPSNCTSLDSTTVIGRVCTAFDLDPGGLTSVSVSYPDGESVGNTVVVSAHYHYHYITPIHAVLGFFSHGSVPEYVDLGSTTNMRLE